MPQLLHYFSVGSVGSAVLPGTEDPDCPACLADPAAPHLDLTLDLPKVIVNVLTPAPSKACCTLALCARDFGSTPRGIPPPHPATPGSPLPCKVQRTTRHPQAAQGRTFQVPWLRTWP